MGDPSVELSESHVTNHLTINNPNPKIPNHEKWPT